MISNEPTNKKMKMEGEKELHPISKSKDINDLPPENLGQILRSGLSVIDRLHCARVSRHWKWAVGEFGWIDQKTIDYETVFEGISTENLDRYSERFWQFTTEQMLQGTSHLVSLLNLIANAPSNNLVELDLDSFGYDNMSFMIFGGQIAKFLPLFPKLKMLNIFDFDLADFVDFLPSTLRELEMSNGYSIDIQTFEILSLKCPNLKEVPFRAVEAITLDIVNDYLPRFPRLTTLDLTGFVFEVFEEQNGILAAIAELKQLKVLKLLNCRGFNAESFKAIMANCQNLLKVDFGDVVPLEEASLFHLAKLPNLVVLEIMDLLGAFTDSVLIEIAKLGQLKRLIVQSNGTLTDDAIVYLIDQCKSLVSLTLWKCPQITERSLEAVVSEVQRRHGNPPRTLPIGPEDSGMFYFECDWTEANEVKALEITAENPWISLHHELLFENEREFF